MKSNVKTWMIFIIEKMEEKINPAPAYQRGEVWNLDKKQRLIDSILRGYDIPKFYLRISNDGGYEYEVVDGQQRLRAVWEFLNNKYALGETSDDLPDFDDLVGKKYSDLPTAAVNKIGRFELTVLEIEEASDLEITDLFLRLQQGVALIPAEKRNAMLGNNMRDFVAELAEHGLFQSVRMTKNSRVRRTRDDWIAHVVCLELAGNATDIKAKNLQKMYESEAKFNPNSPKAKKIKQVLNYMKSVFRVDTPELNIKWGFVDLYWLVSNLIDEYDLGKRHSDFHTFYVTFEQRRRAVDDIQDLLASGDYLDRELFEYIQPFKSSGAVKKNIETRHKVYRTWFHHLFPDLVPKDPTRAFNTDERMIIWRRAGEKCRECGKKIKLSQMEADHAMPHARGGKTTLDNAQCLCTGCNGKKSASLPT